MSERGREATSKAIRDSAERESEGGRERYIDTTRVNERERERERLGEAIYVRVLRDNGRERGGRQQDSERKREC